MINKDTQKQILKTSTLSRIKKIHRLLKCIFYSFKLFLSYLNLLYHIHSLINLPSLVSLQFLPHHFMINVLNPSAFCINMGRSGGAIQAQLKTTTQKTFVMCFSDYDFTSITKSQILWPLFQLEFMILSTFSQARRWLFIDKLTALTFETDVCPTGFAMIPFGENIKHFPASNAIKCHVFIVVSETCSNNRMTGLTEEIGLLLMNFGLKTFVQ